MNIRDQLTHYFNDGVMYQEKNICFMSCGSSVRLYQPSWYFIERRKDGIKKYGNILNATQRDVIITMMENNLPLDDIKAFLSL